MSGSGCCNRQLTKKTDKYRNIEIKVEMSRNPFPTRNSCMLIVKLDYGFRLNLYLEFDIFVVDFNIYPGSTINMHKSGVRERVKYIVIELYSVNTR